MKRSLISTSCILVLLGGCANMADRTSGERIPANPPGFGLGHATQHDNTQALSAERDALTQSLAQMRTELDAMRQLFKLQSLPLTTGASNADALSGITVASAPAVPATVVVERIPAPSPAPVAATAKPVPAQQTTPSDASKKPSPATYTTLFRFASASLDDTSRAALAALRPQLLGANKVQLNAFADTSGDQALNAKLAQARAQSVATELAKLGVPKDRIKVSAAVADSKPPESATILGLFQVGDTVAVSRRVDLAIL